MNYVNNALIIIHILFIFMVMCMDVIERIFELLQEKGMQQKTFAERIGATQQIVTAWKKSTSASYVKYLPQMAEVLGTNVQWLLTGEGEKNRQTATPKGSGSSEEFAKLFVKLTPENQKLIIAAMQGMQPDK
ncbi:helix-turn-helix transcriptional regulator [Oscillibacter sp.]|uniref:helix-turn-helix domain-containing protein n=1 Tax=Oscillibacter sp. TaxID=1945593 RepID=UPI0028A7A998|nr:helix-turn-helix transcriptional regulator [Oscillibacter sp.]